jgi:hypothetical protein
MDPTLFIIIFNIYKLDHVVPLVGMKHLLSGIYISWRSHNIHITFNGCKVPCRKVIPKQLLQKLNIIYGDQQ